MNNQEKLSEVHTVLTPKKKTIDFILNYSSQIQTIKSSHVNAIILNLN